MKLGSHPNRQERRSGSGSRSVSTRLLAGKLLLACFVIACGKGQQSASSQPEDAVKNFIAAWMKRDPQAMAKLISPKPTDEKSLLFLKALCKLNVKLEGSSFVSTITGDRAKVSYVLHSSSTIWPAATDVQNVSLVKASDGWKLTPDMDQFQETRLIGPTAAVAAFHSTKDLYGAIDANNAALCMQNMREIGNAIVKYAYDHNDVLDLPKSQEGVRKALSSSVDESHWFCPNEINIRYSVNLNIIGTSYDDMLNPARTVLLYDGSDEKLMYHHFGNAAMVCFADGHQERVRVQDAPKLIWK